MGWQQYSRPLWLSRPNHYMLYLNAITVQMHMGWLVFHKWHDPAKANRVLAGRLAAKVLSALRRLNLVSLSLPGTYVLGYVGVGCPWTGNTSVLQIDYVITLLLWIG
jgi:hypothetical protein